MLSLLLALTTSTLPPAYWGLEDEWTPGTQMHPAATMAPVAPGPTYKHLAIGAFIVAGPGIVGGSCASFGNPPVKINCSVDEEDTCEAYLEYRKLGGGTEIWWFSDECDGEPLAICTTDPLLGLCWWFRGTKTVL